MAAVGSNSSFGQKLRNIFKKKEKPQKGEYQDAGALHDFEKDAREARESANLDFDLKPPAPLKKRNSESDIKINNDAWQESKDGVQVQSSRLSPDKKDHALSVPKAATTISKPFSFMPNDGVDEIDLLGVTPTAAKTEAQLHQSENMIPDLLNYNHPPLEDLIHHAPTMLQSPPSDPKVKMSSMPASPCPNKKVETDHAEGR